MCDRSESCVITSSTSKMFGRLGNHGGESVAVPRQNCHTLGGVRRHIQADAAKWVSSSRGGSHASVSLLSVSCHNFTTPGSIQLKLARSLFRFWLVQVITRPTSWHRITLLCSSVRHRSFHSPTPSMTMCCCSNLEETASHLAPCYLRPWQARPSRFLACCRQ